MGKGCKLSRAQQWWQPWTLEMWTLILERSLSRHLVLHCCLQWFVVRLILTLQKRHAECSLSAFQLAKWDRPGSASNRS